MCTDCWRAPKAGGHAIHPFAVGALTFLIKGGTPVRVFWWMVWKLWRTRYPLAAETKARCNGEWKRQAERRVRKPSLMTQIVCHINPVMHVQQPPVIVLCGPFGVCVVFLAYFVVPLAHFVVALLKLVNFEIGPAPLATKKFSDNYAIFVRATKECCLAIGQIREAIFC